MIKLLKVNDYKKMLWKNGEGYTFEIARSIGEYLDHFDWRISMADVKTSGSFSKFRGMNRFLTVLEGHGISLNIDGALHHLSTLESIQFNGESAVTCRLLDGPIRDFNLIYNPKKFTADYQWFSTSKQFEIRLESDLSFIFNQSIEPLIVEFDQQIFHLNHQECLRVESEKSVCKLILNKQQFTQFCLIQLIKI